MANPVDRGFNTAVLHIASRLFPTGYDVAIDAPDTLEKLSEHIRTTGRMVVSSAHCANTIFDDAEVNYAFRAWHDLYHHMLQAPFTPAGEALVAQVQAWDLVKLYGREKAAPWCELIDAEVNGQAAYEARHGRFPRNQIAFDLVYLRDPEAALSNPAF